MVGNDVRAPSKAVEKFNEEQKRKEDAACGNTTTRTSNRGREDRAPGEPGALGVPKEGTVQNTQGTLEEHAKSEVARLRTEETVLKCNIEAFKNDLVYTRLKLEVAEKVMEVINASTISGPGSTKDNTSKKAGERRRSSGAGSPPDGGHSS